MRLALFDENTAREAESVKTALGRKATIPRL